MSYSVEEVVQNLNQNTTLVIIAGVVIFVRAYIQYIEAVRLGFKHKTHAIPFFSNMFFFAHDIFFIALFYRWFYELNHWMYKLFWVALIIFTVLEVMVHYQTIKYSRKEILPQLSQSQFILAYLGMQVFIAVIFWFIYSQIDDYLFLISFAITEILSNVFNIPMLLKRGSRKGQSFLLAIGLLIGSNIGYFFFFGPLVSSHFNSPLYFTMGACLTILNLIYIAMLKKTPAFALKV